ncbi:hypothetical protein M0R45_007397 [Rubus argutus]|uniref:Uncharacterized protein n=1 Tax=Rubus argutus TaxID=59490 RepID=A0AAW1XXK5_RUBAR
MTDAFVPTPTFLSSSSRCCTTCISPAPQPPLLTPSLSGAGITTEPTALSLLHTTPPLKVEPIPVLCSSPSSLACTLLLCWLRRQSRSDGDDGIAELVAAKQLGLAD